MIPLLFRAALTESPVTIFGDGQQARDFTYVDNVVDANLLAATGTASALTGHAVNVGAGSRTSLMDLVALVEEISGRRITVRHAPERAGDVRDSQASLDRGGAVPGYAPRVTVRAGIERLQSWYLTNPGGVMATAHS